MMHGDMALRDDLLVSARVMPFLFLHTYYVLHNVLLIKPQDAAPGSQSPRPQGFG
jgi:hypothetical protein